MLNLHESKLTQMSKKQLDVIASTVINDIDSRVTKQEVLIAYCHLLSKMDSNELKEELGSQVGKDMLKDILKYTFYAAPKTGIPFMGMLREIGVTLNFYQSKKCLWVSTAAGGELPIKVRIRTTLNEVKYVQ